MAMTKSNNEVSREILSCLREKHPQAVKFVEIVKALHIEEKALFKNLFFLEENHLIQLMSSYPTGATYPTIHMVKIKEEGLRILDDEEKLDAMFPLKGFSSRLDLYRINNMTLAELASALRKLIETRELVLREGQDELLKGLQEIGDAPEAAELTLGKIFEHC